MLRMRMLQRSSGPGASRRPLLGPGANRPLAFLRGSCSGEVHRETLEGQGGLVGTGKAFSFHGGLLQAKGGLEGSPKRQGQRSALLLGSSTQPLSRKGFMPPPSARRPIASLKASLWGSPPPTSSWRKLLASRGPAGGLSVKQSPDNGPPAAQTGPHPSWHRRYVCSARALLSWMTPRLLAPPMVGLARRGWAWGAGDMSRGLRALRHRRVRAMELRHRELWLWLCLWLRALVAGRPHQPPRGEAGYRLVRPPQGFPAAQAWCWLHGGSLLHSWDPQARGFLQRHLISGSKSWVAPHAEVPQEPGETRGQGQSSVCQSLIRIGDQFWARRGACTEKLPFVCQSGPHRLRREASRPQPRRHPCTVRCRPRPGARTTPGLTREPLTGPQSFRPGTPNHQQADGPTDGSSTPWRPTSEPVTGIRHSPGTGLELSPQTRPGHRLESSDQHRSGTTAASTARLQSSPQPIPDDGPPTPEAAVSPEPGTQPPPTSKTSAKGPESPLPRSTVGSITLSPQDVPHEDKGQALEQLVSQFNQLVQTLGHPLAVERASQALQDLTSSPALLSEDDQAQASHALRFLSAQLPTEPLASNSSHPGLAAAASSLFQSLSSLLLAMGANASSSDGSKQQWGAALAETLAALPLIQTGLLLASSSTEAGVTVASPALSTTLSSRSATSLPHSSFHLPQPKPLTVTFPATSSLAPMLSQQGQAPVQVQVASFACDPFRPLGGKPMASVASVALRAGGGPLSIRGLPEEIEIALGGEGEAEGSAAWLNGSWGHFRMEVNVTSLEDALLVSVRPTAPSQITLCLVSPPHAHSNSCLLNTTLPKGRWQEEGAYVWVVPPENLRLHGPGTYSLSAEAAAQPPQGPRNLSISVASMGCYHWDSQAQAWRSNGCRVGPLSTLRRTQCLCSHLSFFGRFLLVMPHVIDLRRVGQLLSRVGQNPAGLALLCCLLLAYGALLLWARRKQKVDKGKAKVTALADNAASAHCCYLVQVFTGYRRGAATSAKVILTLYGAEGRSEPHLLQHPQAPRFETGSMDAFLLTTQRPLGTLHAIRLWHNNSGASPGWFVRRLVVSDLAARKKWYFLCNCWLAVDMEGGRVDEVFVAASDRELCSFGNLFWAGLVEKLSQEHLWLSVVMCSAWSPFTRVQRLSCCLSLLLCSMLINIMFWKGPVEEEPQPGPFAVTWRDLVVSLQAAVLLMPLQLLIVHIFQLVPPPALEPPPVGPQPPPPAAVPSKQLPTITFIQQELTEMVGFLYKNPLCRRQEPADFPGTWKQTPELVAGLCALVRSSLQQLQEPETLTQERSSSLHSYLCHVVRDLEAQLRRLDGHSLPNPYDHLHAQDQLHRLRQQLEQQNPWPGMERPSQLSSFPMEAPLERRGPCCRGPLGRLQFLCWLVVVLAGLGAGFFTVLYSLQLSSAQATRWVTSIVLSTLQGVLLMQPLKVLALTGICSLMRRRELWHNRGQEQTLRWALALIELPLPAASPGSRGWTPDPIYRPPTLQPAVQPKERATKEKMLSSLVREIVVQLVFLAVLMVLCYAERSPSEFYLNDALQKSFAPQVGGVQTLEHLCDWARRTLLPTIYRDSKGFATGANSFLVGSVRLRQIRAEGGPEQLGPAFLWPQLESGAASQEGSGCAHWGPGGRAHEDAWVFQSETTLQEYPTWGKFAVYPGGGYLADLGTNASHANRTLHALARGKWLDRCTRAVFVEFTVYNANANLFCAVTVMLETNGIGVFAGSTALQILRLYPNSQMLVPLVCAQLTFLLLLLYYVVVQGQCVKQQKWRYCRSQENLLDAFSILISLTVVGLYVRRRLLAAGVLRQYRQDRSRFVRISEVAKADTALTYSIAFLVALTTIKLWNLLRLNPRMYLITRTLRKAWDQILGFLLTLLVLLTGYAFACNLLLGWSLFSFKTFFDSVVTIVGLLAGIFNYEAVLALDPLLGSLLLLTSVLSMVFVTINLLVSALLTVFSREMKAAKICQEESMMQLIQLKISSWFGIKQRAPRPAQEGAARD
uniref:polycystic kidney disease protein 1-like 3 n=1 Tax=Euleptes europaea TaxID=460621 RepID=UPI0025409A93|nr:polycystic kidney disease protein 1-like 3 [Euleptes europaea]